MNYLINSSFYDKLLKRGQTKEQIDSKVYAIVSNMPRLLTIETSKKIEVKLNEVVK